MASWTRTDELLRLRVAAQGIVGTRQTPLAAVERMLALQGQDFGAVRWAIGLRSGASDAEVTASFTAGEIVRAWTMRGTLFAVAAADLAWMLSITEPRMKAQSATRLAQLDIDEKTLETAREAVVVALSGGHAASRTEVMELFRAAGIAPEDQRGYLLIARLAQTGTLCWGPVSNGVQLLVLVDEWVGESIRLERDEALAEFLVRYLRGHGPATLRDFAGWAKLTLTEAKTARAIAGERVALWDGHTEFLVESTTDTTPATPPERRAFRSSIHTLAAFDEYYLGYTDRSAIIEKRFEEAVVPGGNGVFKPIIVSGGQVLGVWRRMKSANGVGIETTPFADPFSAAQRSGLERRERAFARFTGSPVA